MRFLKLEEKNMSLSVNLDHSCPSSAPWRPVTERWLRFVLNLCLKSADIKVQCSGWIGRVWELWFSEGVVTPCGLWDLSSPIRDWTWATAVKALSPNRWTIRGIPWEVFEWRWHTQKIPWLSGSWICHLGRPQGPCCWAVQWASSEAKRVSGNSPGCGVC